jgi:hypothetical protein
MPSRRRRPGRYDSRMSAAVASSPSGSKPQGALCPAQRLHFRLGAAVLALDVSDGPASRVVDRVYGPMRCEAPRGHPLTSAIRRLADGRLYARFGRDVLTSPRAPEAVPERAAYSASREIFARFAASVEGTVAFYGASIAVDSFGVMILGASTIGKTLLVLHAVHHGATFLGDETAMLLVRSAEVFGMPRRPALRESAIPLLPSDAFRAAVRRSRDVFEGEHGKFWYAIDVTPSERALPLRAVCIVRERGDAFKARLVDLDDALPLIAQRAYARPAELNQLAALRKALRHVACLEITLGTPHESAAALLREVSACV